jgi:hypothetical protein
MLKSPASACIEKVFGLFKHAAAGRVFGAVPRTIKKRRGIGPFV